MRTGWLKLAMASVAAAPLMMGASAQAQDASGTALQEVVVTAQRREQNLQAVPASVSAVSGEALAKAQVSDIRQLLVTTPNISYTQFRSNEPTLYVRGIGPFLNTVGLERPTGFYVDDVYTGGSGVSGMSSLFGIERVEVLRGPQGTLFGRNVTGGVIQYVTKDPSRDFEGRVAGTYGNYDFFQAQGYVSVPLSEKAAANLAVSYGRRDGYARNATTGSELEDDNSYGFRAKVRVDVGDSGQLILTGDWFNRYGNGTSRTSIRNNGFGAPIADPRAGPQPVGLNAYDRGAVRLRPRGVSVRYKDDLGFANLNVILAYREYFSRDWQNAQARVPATPSLNIPASTTQVTSDNSVEQDQTSAEIRLDRSSEKFDYVAGVFLLKENVSGQSITSVSPNNGVTLASSTRTFAPVEAESYAAFVDGIYHLTPQFSIGGGLRYTRDRKKVAYAPVNLLTNAVIFRKNDRYSNGEWTYRLLGQYEPTRDINLYAVYSRGYKSGGFDTEATSLAGSVALDPEIADSYEIGLKSNWLDNRLRVNLAAFRIDLQDYQISALDPVSLVTRSFNAGDIRTKGFEVEVAARILPGLQVNAGYGYTDAVYTSPILSAGVNINGFKVQRVPKNTFNLGAVYTVETAFGEIDARGDYAYVDEMEGNERNQVQNRHPSFETINASIGWSNGDGLEVRLWGRNLTDELVVRQITSNGPNQVGAIYDAPRTYGVTLTKSW